jgi:hypothetical protein
MGDTPIGRAQFGLSGEGLRRRVDAAEQRAMGPKPQVKKPKKKPTPNMIKPQQKFVNQRQAQIAAARQADLAAIAAKQAKGLRR